MKAIADTGFLVAFANRNDEHHPWAMEIANQITEPLLTCDAVLAEAAFHLRNSALVLMMIEDGLVRSALSVTQNLRQLLQLAKRYANREPAVSKRHTNDESHVGGCLGQV